MGDVLLIGAKLLNVVCALKLDVPPKVDVPVPTTNAVPPFKSTLFENVFHPLIDSATLFVFYIKLLST